MQVHIFEMSSVGGSEDIYRLKSSINNWLDKEGQKIEIKHVLQNAVEKQGAVVYTISVWYETQEEEKEESPQQEQPTQKGSVDFPAI